MTYIILNTVVFILEKASGGRIRPADKDIKDPWTYKIEGGLLPPWVTRVAKGKKDFWRPYDDPEHIEDPTKKDDGMFRNPADGNAHVIEGKSGATEVGEISRDSASSGTDEKDLKKV